VTFYSAVFPFLSFCPDFLHNKFSFSASWSGVLSSFVYFGTIIFTPLFGLFVDKRGKRATLMFYGSAMLIVVHLILAFTRITPYIPIFILGISFSLVPAAMWPAVGKLVEEKRLGTAYGLMTWIQSFGLFLFPMFAGRITDLVNPGHVVHRNTVDSIQVISSQLLSSGMGASSIGSAQAVQMGLNEAAEVSLGPLDYTYTIFMFAGLGLFGFLFAYLLKREDRNRARLGLELIEEP
jgi:MFS family permease